MKIRIATRKSELALIQTRWVAAHIQKAHPEVQVEEVHVVTQGDKILDRPLMNIGGKGLFVSEVEACLADGRADLAVHSMKDVPGELADGLDILCVPEREDPRDVIVSPDGEELDGLVAGTKVGTSSLRRTAQLRSRRPDLHFASIRGNVGTRIGKMESGEFGAVILALAGLNRLGLTDRPMHVLSPEWCIPAIGQGALAIEGRADDDRTRSLLSHMEHEATRLAVVAERAFLGKLEGNCKSPIAGHAKLTDGGNRVSLDGMVASLGGERILTGASTRTFAGRDPHARLADAKDLGLEVAENLIESGADKLIREAMAAAERVKRLN